MNVSASGGGGRGGNGGHIRRSGASHASVITSLYRLSNDKETKGFGAEGVRDALNSALGALISTVERHGGDVLRIAGDALIVLFHQVHSGDQISVAVPGDPVGQERRVALSSIRAPRVGNPRRGVEDEPWAVEAKEALRKLAIGKTVKVVVDYQRDIPQTSGGDLPPVKRAFATVSVGSSGRSLQETLVETGMAAVARLRQDDPRTEQYDAIVASEANAKAAKKGVHSGG